MYNDYFNILINKETKIKMLIMRRHIKDKYYKNIIKINFKNKKNA